MTKVHCDHHSCIFQQGGVCCSPEAVLVLMGDYDSYCSIPYIFDGIRESSWLDKQWEKFGAELYLEVIYNFKEVVEFLREHY